MNHHNGTGKRDKNLPSLSLILWSLALFLLSLTPYAMKVLDYSPLMSMAVAIAAICVLVDGVTTFLIKKFKGTEMNPLINLLFRKVGVRFGLTITRLIGFALVIYGILSDNPYMILGISWLFLLAGFVGLSSIALMSSTTTLESK